MSHSLGWKLGSVCKALLFPLNYTAFHYGEVRLTTLECTHVLLGWANKNHWKTVLSDETIWGPMHKLSSLISGSLAIPSGLAVSTHYMLTG